MKLVYLLQMYLICQQPCQQAVSMLAFCIALIKWMSIVNSDNAADRNVHFLLAALWQIHSNQVDELDRDQAIWPGDVLKAWLQYYCVWLHWPLLTLANLLILADSCVSYQKCPNCEVKVEGICHRLFPLTYHVRISAVYFNKMISFAFVIVCNNVYVWLHSGQTDLMTRHVKVSLNEKKNAKLCPDQNYP